MVHFRKSQEVYFFSEISQPVLLTVQLPMQWVPGPFSPTAKRAGAWGLISALRADVNMCRSTFTPSLWLYGVDFDKFTVLPCSLLLFSLKKFVDNTHLINNILGPRYLFWLTVFVEGGWLPPHMYPWLRPVKWQNKMEQEITGNVMFYEVRIFLNV